MKWPLTFAEWGGAEFSAALRAYLSKDKVSPIGSLQERLRLYFKAEGIFPLGRARMGLEIALREFAAARPERTEVIFPAYICPCIPATIKSCGLIPIAADIDGDLNVTLADTKRRMSEKTLGVIVAHMYGVPAAIKEFEQFCRSRGIFLVDDAAQVIGVKKDGRPLGSFGDCGLLSFSQSKTIVAGSGNAGGVLIARGGEFSSRIAARWQMIESRPLRVRDALSFMHNVYWQARTRNLRYYLSKLPDRDSEDGNGSVTRIEKISSACAATALCQLNTVSQRVAGRARVAAWFRERLSGQTQVKLAQCSDGAYVTRIVVALSPGLDLTLLRRRLEIRGVQTRCGYPPGVPDARDYPGLRSISGRLLEIPSHSRMSSFEVDELCSELVSAIKDT